VRTSTGRTYRDSDVQTKGLDARSGCGPQCLGSFLACNGLRLEHERLRCSTSRKHCPPPVSLPRWAGPKPHNCILKGVEKKRCTTLLRPLGPDPKLIQRRGPSLEHKAVLTNPLGDGNLCSLIRGPRPQNHALWPCRKKTRGQGAVAKQSWRKERRSRDGGPYMPTTKYVGMRPSGSGRSDEAAAAWRLRLGHGPSCDKANCAGFLGRGSRIRRIIFNLPGGLSKLPCVQG